MIANATFSPEPQRKYRYSLWRIWDETKETVLFIGLNPSNADDVQDDQTIKRLINFCKSWGYGGFYIANLFAFVTPDPKILKNEPNPIGDDNDNVLQGLIQKCSKTILMWGNHGKYKGRDQEVLKMVSDPYCVSITKDGFPIHPVRQKATSALRKFEQPVHLKFKGIEIMKNDLSEEFQSVTVYKINPNKQERNGDVILDRNVDGRIFRNLKISLNDHAIVLKNEEDEVEGIFSLHHYYFLKN